MSLTRSCLLACMLAGLAPAIGAAAEFNMDVKADGIRLGKNILGPDLSAADLKDRVVMIEMWGVH